MTVLGVALGMMVANLMAMLFVRQFMRWVGLVPLQILGAVLAVLQVALAMQILVMALRAIGIDQVE